MGGAATGGAATGGAATGGGGDGAAGGGAEGAPIERPLLILSASEAPRVATGGGAGGGGGAGRAGGAAGSGRGGGAATGGAGRGGSGRRSGGAGRGCGGSGMRACSGRRVGSGGRTGSGGRRGSGALGDGACSTGGRRSASPPLTSGRATGRSPRTTFDSITRSFGPPIMTRCSTLSRRIITSRRPWRSTAKLSVMPRRGGRPRLSGRSLMFSRPPSARWISHQRSTTSSNSASAARSHAATRAPCAPRRDSSICMTSATFPQLASRFRTSLPHKRPARKL